MYRIYVKIISILFRCILVLISIFIVSTSNNLFPIYLYIITIVSYVSFYLYLAFKNGSKWDLLRLINDFFLILVVSYGQNPSKPLILLLLLSPVLNIVNHSGENKNKKYLYFLTFLVFLLESKFGIIPFYAVAFVLSISGLTLLKMEIQARFGITRNKLEKCVEDFIEIDSSYKIYKPIIEIINDSKLLGFFYLPIDSILCFKVMDGRLEFFNSSKFVYVYSFEPDMLNKIVKDIDHISIGYDLEGVININKIEYTNFIIHKQKSKNNNYLFIILPKTDQIWHFHKVVFSQILYPIFNKLVGLIEIDIVINKQTKNYNKKIKNKFLFVKNSEKAMHFIKNKLSPIDNFLATINDYLFVTNNIILDKDDKIYFKKELVKAEHNLDKIVQTAKNILDKEANPFNVTNIEIKSAHDLYSSVLSVYNDYFKVFDSVFKWEEKSVLDYSVKYNEEGLYILLTDWVSNMKKYGKECMVEFSENDEYFIISFYNKFLSSHTSDINKLVNDFNSHDRTEILRRESHGIFQIRTLVDEMKLYGTLIITHKKQLQFELRFTKILKNEVVNIRK